MSIQSSKFMTDAQSFHANEYAEELVSSTPFNLTGKHTMNPEENTGFNLSDNYSESCSFNDGGTYREPYSDPSEIWIEDMEQAKAMAMDQWIIREARAELRAIEDALDLCREAEQMVKDTLSTKKNLLKYHKKELSLDNMVYGKPTKKRQAKAELYSAWCQRLPYGLKRGTYYDGTEVLHLVNRYYLVRDQNHPEKYVSPQVNELGFVLEFDPRMIVNMDQGHIWLYNSRSEPWSSPQNAKQYLRRLQYLMAALECKRASLRVVAGV
ncbi:hypothetical protein [Acidithiobacillus acidisediminis]|uniref:hypothetical protein n=1 Tax=Acidithiobacillus acidisediminis TaxID=2937799 RepID=UPI00200DFDC9|nr:hypothetical protein [Acidithiobacillus sp. S30A2]